MCSIVVLAKPRSIHWDEGEEEKSWEEKETNPKRNRQTSCSGRARAQTHRRSEFTRNNRTAAAEEEVERKKKSFNNSSWNESVYGWIIIMESSKTCWRAVFLAPFLSLISLASHFMWMLLHGDLNSKMIRTKGGGEGWSEDVFSLCWWRVEPAKQSAMMSLTDVSRLMVCTKTHWLTLTIVLEMCTHVRTRLLAILIYIFLTCFGRASAKGIKCDTMKDHCFSVVLTWLFNLNTHRRRAAEVEKINWSGIVDWAHTQWVNESWQYP